jgi:alpha-L-rhamnosidase
MNQFFKFLFIFIGFVFVYTSGLLFGGIVPTKLRCEYRLNPLGIDVVKPRLSWIVESSERGQKQTAYRIVVASSEENLRKDISDLWDTGKILSEQTLHVIYKGNLLRSRMCCYWKIKVWDKDGNPSRWSDSAFWTMGLLNTSDWQASWISFPKNTYPTRNLGPHHGYLSSIEDSPESEKWILLDLKRVYRVNALKLFPARPKALRPYTRHPDIQGYFFPLRFKIDLATKSDFSDVKTVIDKTQEDMPNPVNTAPIYRFSETPTRFVRLTVTRLRDHGDQKFGLALAEIQVLEGKNNVALGASVNVSDLVEEGGGEWSIYNLVDGRVLSKIAKDIPPQPNPATMLRKEFHVHDSAKRAMVYVTGVGLFELRINGQKVEKDLHIPDWTNYLKRIQYKTYDVSQLIRTGKNVVGVILGEGRYAGRIQMWPPRPYLYGARTKMLLRLEIEYDNGQFQTIVSDGSWMSTEDGPIRFSGIYEGETYDARKEMDGWDSPGFNESSWKAVHEERDLGKAKFVWQRNQPIRATKELIPVKFTEPHPGVRVFDLGQNIAGWCRIRVKGQKGTKVELMHGERLNEDGTVYVSNLHAGHWSDARAQTDVFILRGKGEEVYEPLFTYHGFRYVEMTISDGKLYSNPEINTLRGIAFHSDCPVVGRFQCSNPLINQLMSNIIWGQRGNLHGVPTDCPNRDERMGFTGDIQAFSQTAIFNMDMAAFFSKWIQDMRDDQTKDGRYPDFAPNPDIRRSMGEAAWSDAGIIIPWRMYQNYEDTRLLEEHFESAKRWVDFVHRRSKNLISTLYTPGDWLNGDTQRYESWPTAGGQIPNPVFTTAFFAHVTDLLSRIAAVIGRNEEARYYAILYEKIKEAFNREFVKVDGKIEGDTQAGYALALHFDLLPEELRLFAVEHLLHAIDRYKGHLSTGIQASHRLMLELAINGHNDEAYDLLSLRTPPSWGYMIDQGATTIWERWDGYVEGRGFAHSGMNSFNHFAIGSVGEWIWRVVAGINPDEKIPAYKHFIIHPRPGGGLSWARGEYDSIRGKIVSDWSIEDKDFSFDISIPPNTTARVYVPASDPENVTENGVLANESEGVRFIEMQEHDAVYQVNSGIYSFFSKDYKK